MDHLSYAARMRQLTLCVLCCAVLLAAGCSGRRSEQYRGEGDTLFTLGRLDEAKAAYQKSAETNPENPMAQLGLARCAFKGGDIELALTFFEKARTLNPALPESYTEPVMHLVDLQRTDDALAIAEAFLKVAPEKGGLLHSAVLLKADRTADAITELENLGKQFPESSDVKLNLGVAYAQGGKNDEAVALLKEVSQGASPVSTAAHLALIEVYQSQGKVAELLAEFESLAAALPDDGGIQTGHARALLLAGKTEEAEAKARKILEKDPAAGWANYVVGAVKLSQSAFEEAVPFLESAATALPEEKAVSALLAQAKSGKLPSEVETAPVAAPAAIARNPESLTWRDLWKQAALKRLVSNRDTYLAEGGNEVREVLVLSALFTQDVGLARELSGALPAESRVGQFFKAMDSRDPKVVTALFEEWKPEAPEELILRDNALGFAMASGAARGQALSLFLFTLERFPDNMVALYNIAQVFRSVRQPIIAAQQLQRLIVQYPENIDAHQMLYSALREGGAFEPARKAAEASYTLFPEERWSFLYLGQAYLDTGEPELALQVLNRASGLFEGDPEIELAKGGIHARLGDCAQTRAVLEGITSTAPRIIADRANLLALCALQEGDWATVGTLADAADPAFWPESLRVMKTLSALQADNVDGAVAALTVPGADQPAAGKLGLIFTSALGVAVEGLNDDEQAWASTLGADRELMLAYGATLALQMGRLYNASWASYEKNLAGRTPHLAIAQLAIAALQFGDKVDGAKEKGQAIVDTVAADPRAWIAYAELLKSLGDAEGEAQSMEKAIATGADSPEVWSRNGAMLEKKKDYKGAAESYRKLVALQPENAPAANNLAYMLLMAGGNDEEALKFATAAQEKVPNNPGILHTLGLAQMRTGDLEASRTTLGRAAEIDPANPTISFDFGRVLMKLGDKEKAKERIRYSLGISARAGLEFPEQAEAESLLTELN
ncbi:MAG: tetratricopeptide repeat protein [Candidatus Hydrogenedentes bacterium]|nr:tetratricopeptide repeat protein [Candidatus Hydrogenedentota bacterium]